MNENENNFESLRHLLALKRHEIPPPGYFENFSTEVAARIRVGEARRQGSVAERLPEELPWLFRFLSVFEAKPAFAGVFAFSLCLLLVGGIVYAERPDAAPQSLLQPDQPGSPLAVATPASFGSMPAEQPNLAPLSSTNPVFSSPSAGGWFASGGASLQPVNFTLPGN
jgi:hypothetical protein